MGKNEFRIRKLGSLEKREIYPRIHKESDLIKGVEKANSKCYSQIPSFAS